MLASCKLPSFLPFGNGQGGTDDPGNEGTDGGADPENLIYNATSEFYIIADPTIENSCVMEIANKLDEKRSEVSLLASADSDAHAHEIVIGNTDREISKTAKDRMNRIEKVTDDEVNFLIYSDGSSVAIVWDEDEDGVARGMALEYFISNYINEELISPSNVLHSNTVNLLDYYTAKDEAFKTPLWESFEKKYGAELTSAYNKLYAIYSDDVVIWLADLYDPDICVCVDLYGEEECSGTKYCGTGGFYYSNSARDTTGYLPDAESTYQALNILVGAGLASQRDGTYFSIITEEMKEQIGDFIYALEEPNGYFYHPQWGIEFTDTKISRRARDLDWCCAILRRFGRLPKYTTASGMVGEDVAGASAPLTGGLGQSTVLSVSKVVAVSGDSYASHIQSLESFKEYLAGLDIRNSSYSIGNTLTAQTSQFVARDKQIGTEDNPTPLMSYLIEWLNAAQNPETGTWDWKKPGDEGYEDYHGTNGLLKISGIYDVHGVVMPYSKEAAHSAMADIVNPAPINGVVDLYNTWFVIEIIISTLRNYGGEEGIAEAEEILAELRADAPNAVIISRNKISEFLKPDGSASYTKKYSSVTSQGCPVAVPNTVEGDVNATAIGVVSIIGYSVGALGVSEDRVPLFGEKARYLFRKEIANLSPIKKDGAAAAPEVIDFDYDEIGEQSSDLQINHYGGNGTAFVIADPTGSDKGNVTEIRSYAGCGDSIILPLQNVISPNATYIFEGDFYIQSCVTNYSAQITLGNCYMFTFRPKGNNIELWESSSPTGSLALEEYLGVSIPKESWFRVRIEYYPGDHDSVRIKFYCDTDLTDDEGMKLYAVSDNYYDQNGYKLANGVGTPNTYYGNTQIYIMSSENTKIYIDNLNFYRTTLAYSAVTDPNDQPYFNVDAPQ